MTGTCLISFDSNRYLVMAKRARRAVQARAYADRIVVRRFFGRDRMILDAWYLTILARTPGALRDGAPLQDWELPPALARPRRKLGSGDEAARRFVRVLSAVPTDSLGVVEDTTREALDNGAASYDVILNNLARRGEPPRPPTIVTSEAQMLAHPPIADCARYDLLRDVRAAFCCSSPARWRSSRGASACPTRPAKGGRH